MPRRCAIGCTPTRGVLHVFPNPGKFPEQFNAWVRVVTGKDECDFDYKKKRICDRHFTERDRNRNKRLNALAVPSLFLFDNLVDMNKLSEPCVPKITISEQSLDQTKALDHHQSTSVNNDKRAMPTDCLNYSKTNGSMIMPLVSNIQQSSSSEPTEVSGNPLLEHNYCKVVKEYQQRKSGSRQQPSAVMSSKYRVYQKNIKNLRRQVYRLRKRGKDIKSRLDNAEKLFNKSDFQKLVKNMKPAAKVFSNMQYYQALKKPTGRRFRIEEKVLSLALYKRSPKCYGLMSKYFVLPSTKSLKRLLAKINLSAGINKIVFEKLRKTVSNFDTEDRLCTVIFDEMSIMPQVHYDSSKDELKGFASHNTNKIANHSLVFMVKGIRKSYKQPVAYYFTNSLNKHELKAIIKEVIKNVQETGLIVLATVCDQSTVNVGAIEELIKETKANYLRKQKEVNHNFIELNGKRIIPLYDVPHLLKGLRNNLLTKNLSYVDYEDGEKTKIVKWEYLQQLYAADKSFGELRCLQKLTEEHIVPEKIKKMRVKTAAQIFSHSVAVATEHLTARGNLPKECRDLIPITLLIDNLFDSMNCNSFKIPNGKVYKGPIRRNTPHHQLWQKAIKYFKSITFVTTKKIGNKIQKSETVVPSVTNFIKTIEGIQELWKIVTQKYSFDSMFTRHFNQDPVENFFGSIRNCGARNTAPNSVAFEGAFKTLLINNFSAPHSSNGNCEDDKNNFLQTLDFFVTKSAPESSDVSENRDTLIASELDVPKEKDINIRTDFLNSDGVTDLGQRDYVCGWVLRKCLENLIKNCKTCRESVLSTKNTTRHSFIRAKEYFSDKKLLVYPSKQLHECFRDIQNICVSHLKTDVPKSEIKRIINMHADIFVHYPFKCETHKNKLKQYFTDTTVNIIIYSWCRSINRILAGKLTYDGDDGIKLYAQQYYNKNRHNKTNK